MQKQEHPDPVKSKLSFHKKSSQAGTTTKKGCDGNQQINHEKYKGKQ